MSIQSAISQFSKTLYNTYDAYKFNGISSRRMKHAELLKHLQSLLSSLGNLMKMEQVGTSAEGRSINLLTLGSGKTIILNWSQMHGDEPTATMALLDILNYISLNQNSLEVKKILAGTTLLIIPMLNPDGAERFQRRTSQGIDMNRDAMSLQTPEARIFKEIRDKFNPEIGFNLHDQDPWYTVGNTGDVSTIALLAPAFNIEKSDNAVRLKSKKVAAEFALVLQQFIPKNISKYDDSFYPRAFGDNVQKWGTSTVLVESGGWKDDPEKKYIRKLNCVGLLSVYYSIATKSYEKTDIAVYDTIPMNTKNMFDILIQQVTIVFGDKRPSVVADVGINVEEVHDPSGLKWKGRVVDLGDLSVFSAHEKWNGKGREIKETMVELNEIVNLEEIKRVVNS